MDTWIRVLSAITIILGFIAHLYFKDTELGIFCLTLAILLKIWSDE